MTTFDSIGARARGGKTVFLLLSFLVFLVAASPEAQACQAFGGLIDGFVNPNPPSQIQIDGNCTIRNFPASNPLTSNFSFFTQPGQTNERWLIIFDNVVHTGQMACNAVHGHKIWFTNGSSSSIQQGCQNLLIPVEKIDKQNPAGQTTAAIGVPFTYTLTIPVLFDPATGTVINHDGSLNDLHGITVRDDLNDTGVDLTYLGHVAYWLDDNTPVPHTFSNVGGSLTFDNIPIVAAGRQFVIEITVVLEDTPVNAAGTQFVNTAKWDFGRLIDGVFYQPLPGEWGVSPPLTIAAPNLVVTKSGPPTMNLGQWDTFVIDVRNAGLSDAWDMTLRDLLPDGSNGGMCDQTPEILSARVFAADGVTPVPGKGPLTQGVDYTLSYAAAPSCRLDLAMRTAAGAVGAGQRLIVTYRTQLDSNTQNGVALTNVAGAVQYFNGDSSNPDRIVYSRLLTDGTVGVADHEDAHTVLVDLKGFFFDKTVADATNPGVPISTAAPGDRLRYTLRFRTTDDALADFRVFDELDALNTPPAFVPGSLTLVTYPAGANIGGTSGTGGSAGTGVLDVAGLTLPAGSELLVEFDITLDSSLTNGTVVSNQSTLLRSDGTTLTLSDDPYVNGTADPLVPGDEDPTRVTIVSAPDFLVQKTSTDLTADPNILLAGESLRYTITVKNVGNEDAVNVVLRDAVPANTAYVAGSTTLNGAAAPDAGGLSPLVNGMSIHSPADPTPGSMPADASANPNNVATVTFDVVVDPGVVDGTIISNQGFVSALSQGIVDRPSDDPDTPVPDDPTRDVVGALPLLFADKRVALLTDLGSPGIVDPGDVLRYTITVQNSAATAATGVVLTDPVPANTAYVAGSTTLNGAAVPDVGGSSPLASGIDVSSSDLAPPLPAPGTGTISPGESAVLQFDLQVLAGTAPGTVISNQAVVGSNELADLLTDGDGDPTTGPEPTIVVVGDSQLLTISKQVTVVGGGAAVPGAELEYLVRVVNVGAVPAYNVAITDDLDAPQPGQLAYVSGSATMNGSTAGVTFAASTITADYAGTYGSLAPGEVVLLRFRATLDPGLTDGTVVVNTGVVAWNTPTQTASADATIAVGGVPGVAVLNGSAWHDADFDDMPGSAERVLSGWTVDLYQGGQLLHSTLTDANGDYRIIGATPNDSGGIPYELRFRAPGAGPATAALGFTDSPFTDGPQRIGDIVVSPLANLRDLNLPIDPNGVVYNSIARIPVAGATLTLVNAAGASPLPPSCFDDPAQQGQVTLTDGYYKFDVSFGDPACPPGGDYVIDVVVPPGTTYVPGYSQIIPPASDPTTAPFSVPACPGGAPDAIPGTTQYCEVQPSEFAPAPSIPALGTGTTHHLHLTLDDTQTPGSSQIFNNHIPLDPDLSGSTGISKTTPLLNVNRGQLVPYVITVNNLSGALLTGVGIVDRFPAGFSYVAGSALIDGVQTEPTISGLELVWDNLTIAGAQSLTLKLLLAVGAGVSEGEYVNRAQVLAGTTGGAISGEAAASVRIVPDPTFDCTDVTGKVFDDANRNDAQDDGEQGLPGVRLVTARGLRATTDEHGRYHITCAITPHESRGSNFVLKLDDRTLPSGFRMSTDALQVKRATRGKVLRIDFGASIHRVVAIDLSDAAFEPDSTAIRVQWRSRFDLLLQELRKAPSLLRLSYVADTESAALVEQRVEAFKGRIVEAWEADDCCGPLIVEQEIFWRLGAPVRKPEAPGTDGR